MPFVCHFDKWCSSTRNPFSWLLCRKRRRLWYWMVVREEEVLVKWKSCGWKEHRHTPSNDERKDFFFVLWQRKKGQSFGWERMIGNDLPFHLGWDFQPIPLSNEMCAYHLIRISRRDYPFAPLLPSGSVVVNSFPGKNTINIGFEKNWIYSAKVWQ